MITLYGATASRASRVLWMLEELGIPYEHEKTDITKGEQKQPEFAKINPNQHVPALKDGDLFLFESLAINLYLADKYGKELKPANEEERALATQWSIWAITEAEPLLAISLQNKILLPEDKRNAQKAQDAESKLGKPFQILNDALEGKDYLMADRFTVTDLNVAAILSWCKFLRIDLSGYPNLSRWFTTSLSRPTFKAALAK